MAFGCRKSDKIARDAARTYLQVVRQLQAKSGAEGCPLESATEVLGVLLEDIRSDRSAAAGTAPLQGVILVR